MSSSSGKFSSGDSHFASFRCSSSSHAAICASLVAREPAKRTMKLTGPLSKECSHLYVDPSTRDVGDTARVAPVSVLVFYRFDYLGHRSLISRLAKIIFRMHWWVADCFVSRSTEEGRTFR